MKPNVSALIRSTIFVRDLEKSVRFYRALGLTETYYEGILEHPSANAIIGFPEVRPLSIHILKRPGPNYGMIGLFKLDESLEAEVLPTATGRARIGEVALIFYVRSMDETLAKLREAGATWSPEPTMFVMPHRQQPEVCLRDCDGVLINLVENDPAEQEQTTSEMQS